MRFAKYLSMIPVLLCAATTHAQDVKVLGVHGKWTAYSFQDNGKLVCYIATNPTSSTGAYKSRGEVLAQVTHRPGDTFSLQGFTAAYKAIGDACGVAS
jgi:hypothetical protein